MLDLLTRPTMRTRQRPTTTGLTKVAIVLLLLNAVVTITTCLVALPVGIALVVVNAVASAATRGQLRVSLAVVSAAGAAAAAVLLLWFTGVSYETGVGPNVRL
jgi:hypothetical protein